MTTLTADRAPPPPRKGTLAALVGTAAAALLMIVVPQFEGTETRAYRDIAGVWTICNGDTANVRPGQVESVQGCQVRLARQLEAHAAPVLACVPQLKAPGRDQQRAAAVSLAYNIGTAAFCRSTTAARFRASDWRGGCDAMMAWNKARVNGRLVPVKGLTTRRAAERAICLKGL